MEKKKEKMNTLFSALSDEKWQKKTSENLKKLTGGFQKDARFWFPKEDPVKGAFAKIRFLPNYNLRGDNVVELKRHYFQTDDGTYITNVICPTTFGEPCPICKSVKVLYDQERKQEAGQRRFSSLYFANIMILKDPQEPENNGKILIWETGHEVLKKIEEKDDPMGGLEEKINIFHPIKGLDFTVKMKRKPAPPGYPRGARDHTLSAFDTAPRAIATTEEEVNALWEKCYHLEDVLFKDSEYERKSYDELLDLLKKHDSETSHIFEIDEKPILKKNDVLGQVEDKSPVEIKMPPIPETDVEEELENPVIKDLADSEIDSDLDDINLDLEVKPEPEKVEEKKPTETKKETPTPPANQGSSEKAIDDLFD
jgi:hypothetical protein